MTKAIGLALIAVLLGATMYIPGSGTATCPQVVRHVAPPVYHHTPVYKEVIVQKEIIAPVAVPVVVPATVFQYLPAVAPVVTAPIAAAPVATAPAVAQPQAVNPGIGDMEKLIEQRVDKAVADRLGRTGPGDGPPPITFEGQTTAAAPPQQPAQPQGNNDKAQVMQAWVQDLGNSCASCHGAGKRSGGVALFDANNQFAPSVSMEQIAESIISGRMPKGRTVSTSEKLRLLRGTMAQ